MRSRLVIELPAQLEQLAVCCFERGAQLGEFGAVLGTLARDLSGQSPDERARSRVMVGLVDLWSGCLVRSAQGLDLGSQYRMPVDEVGGDTCRCRDSGDGDSSAVRLSAADGGGDGLFSGPGALLSGLGQGMFAGPGHRGSGWRWGAPAPRRGAAVPSARRTESMASSTLVSAAVSA